MSFWQYFATLHVCQRILIILSDYANKFCQQKLILSRSHRTILDILLTIQTSHTSFRFSWSTYSKMNAFHASNCIALVSGVACSRQNLVPVHISLNSTKISATYAVDENTTIIWHIAILDFFLFQGKKLVQILFC